jgi:hypothetical protein
MRTASIAALTAIVISAGSAPVQAEIDEETVAGVLAVLGIAALAHNQNHYREGYTPSGAAETADFERGYRDGLHDADYDSRRSSVAYGQGYDAGHKERSNRLSHRTRVESEGPNVPPIAMQGCARVVATNFGVGTHDVHIVRTVQRGPSDFLVEASVGHNHMTCVMNDSSEPVEVYGGPMQ